MGDTTECDELYIVDPRTEGSYHSIRHVVELIDTRLVYFTECVCSRSFREEWSSRLWVQK